jgi:ribosomal protein S18 acetylase RimI-like enzyme
MDIHYRPYVDSDLDRCAALAVEAWPIASVISENTHSLMRVYVKSSLLFSDYTDMCCADDKVIGFLFGLTHKKLPGLKARFELNRLFWEFVAGKYGPSERRFRFLTSFVLTLLKVEWLCFRFDSEVELFVVDAAYRGQGIGRSLVDHFVEHLRDANKRTLYLYTNMVSNWRFYEKYGFIKHGEFHDNELSFLRGTKTHGYIYYYRL